MHCDVLRFRDELSQLELGSNA